MAGALGRGRKITELAVNDPCGQAGAELGLAGECRDGAQQGRFAARLNDGRMEETVGEGADRR